MSLSTEVLSKQQRKQSKKMLSQDFLFRQEGTDRCVNVHREGHLIGPHCENITNWIKYFQCAELGSNALCSIKTCFVVVFPVKPLHSYQPKKLITLNKFD